MFEQRKVDKQKHKTNNLCFQKQYLFDRSQPRGQTTCKNLGFSAIVAANTVTNMLFEQAELRRGKADSRPARERPAREEQEEQQQQQQQ